MTTPPHPPHGCEQNSNNFAADWLSSKIPVTSPGPNLKRTFPYKSFFVKSGFNVRRKMYFIILQEMVGLGRNKWKVSSFAHSEVKLPQAKHEHVIN